MRLACIDIGSNTTRLLVADVDLTGLHSVEEHRAFTHLGHALELDGLLPEAKLAEVLATVTSQLARARDLGAHEVHAVATAAVRQASNGGELVERLREQLDLGTRVLDPAEEARLAFLGAVSKLGPDSAGQSVAVVDVGGGSCELAVGSPPAAVRWTASLPVGSGTLTARHLFSDPPLPAQLEAAHAEVLRRLDELEPPGAERLIAVGGSATSLRRLGGDRLDQATLARLRARARAQPSRELAADAGLEPERARLLPAGLLILGTLAEKFDHAPEIGGGGVREGVLIEAAR